MPTRIDSYSLSAVPVDQLFNDTAVGNATGFVWERQEKFYLVTNWHVVTCRNNETGKCLASHAAEPNRLRALFYPREPRFDTFPLNVPLRDSDDYPTWLFHPIHKRKVDVVAIPLLRPDGEWTYRPINRLPRVQLSIQIGMDVFILGFPFGSPPPSFPIWKRGSMASEPELVRLGEKFYLVDTASRPGMSGGPVVLRSYGAHLTEGGTSITDEPATRFLGIYSGRLKTRDSEDAQLGRVWPESFITEIIDAHTRDPGDRE
jgi:hypothetical protein